MGGLWVNNGLDESAPRHMTNIPGLFAVGECDYQYHGANRLGANSLLSCLTSGQLVGPSVCAYADGLQTHPDGTDPEFGAQVRAQTERYERLKAMDGDENPFALWHEMGTLMTENMTVVRYNDRLQHTLGKLDEMMERYQRIGVSDTAGWTNQVVPFTRQLWNMLILARVMTKGALQRDESRGAHYKPDFPERDDANFLKTTVAEHTPGGPRLWYEAVDISQVKPRLRKYTTETAATAAPAAVTAGRDGRNGHAGGHVDAAVGTAVAGEDTLTGGLTPDDALSTAPAGSYPRDAGTGPGSETSKTAPNMADLEPGKGGAN